MAAPADLRGSAGANPETAPMTAWMEPMLATLTDDRFSAVGWIYEHKLDGIRGIAYKTGHTVHIFSRNRLSLDGSFPTIVRAVAEACPDDVVLDGELVAVERERMGFQALQQRHQRDVDVRYYVFDILRIGHEDLRSLPLRERLNRLEQALPLRPPLYAVERRERDGEAFYAEACANGWEGLIAKDAASPYVGGRSKLWLKFKCSLGQEFVIGGFTDPQRSRVGFGALLVGVYGDDGQLHYAGKVGTGYDRQTLLSLRARLDALERPASPFAEEKGLPRLRVHWTEPRLVAQVEFSEWTAASHLRHPRYVGLRDDKDARDVKREMA